MDKGGSRIACKSGLPGLAAVWPSLRLHRPPTLDDVVVAPIASSQCLSRRPIILPRAILVVAVIRGWPPSRPTPDHHSPTTRRIQCLTGRDVHATTVATRASRLDRTAANPRRDSGQPRMTAMTGTVTRRTTGRCDRHCEDATSATTTSLGVGGRCRRSDGHTAASPGRPDPHAIRLPPLSICNLRAPP